MGRTPHSCIRDPLTTASSGEIGMCIYSCANIFDPWSLRFCRSLLRLRYSGRVLFLLTIARLLIVGRFSSSERCTTRQSCDTTVPTTIIEEVGYTAPSIVFLKKLRFFSATSYESLSSSGSSMTRLCFLCHLRDALALHVSRLFQFRSCKDVCFRFLMSLSFSESPSLGASFQYIKISVSLVSISILIFHTVCFHRSHDAIRPISYHFLYIRSCNILIESLVVLAHPLGSIKTRFSQLSYCLSISK